ncbi:MAG: hypothetical protein ACI9U2_001289 [Bradymonadia bacterium]|jgi:hypothetical protein
MSWVLAIAAIGVFLVAPLVGIIEARRRRAGPTDVGFWVFARAVAGTTHVRWRRRAGRRESPVVRFDLPGSEGRARVEQLGETWRIAVRARLTQPVGFAARLCNPPALPMRWRTPGLAVIESPIEQMSVEANRAEPVESLLKTAAVRHAIETLGRAVPGFELTINHGVVTLSTAVKAAAPGEALAADGDALVDALRVLLTALNDQAGTRADVGEARGGCAACAGALGLDPQICRGCGTPLHRGCRATLSGCISGRCAEAVDALPGARAA